MATAGIIVMLLACFFMRILQLNAEDMQHDLWMTLFVLTSMMAGCGLGLTLIGLFSEEEKK